VQLRFGLRWRALLIVAFTAASSGAAAWLATRYQLRTSVTNDLIGRALIIGRALEESREIQEALTGSQLTIPLVGADEDATAVLRQFIEADRDLIYIVLVDTENKPFLKASADATALPVDDEAYMASLLAHHLESGGKLRDDTVRVNEPVRGRALTGMTGGWEPDLRDVAGEFAVEDVPVPDFDAGELLDDMPDAIGEIDLTEVQQELPAKQILATALLGLSPAAQLSRIESLVRNGFLISGFLVVLVVWLFFGWLYRRIHRLRAYAHQLAGGDLTQRLDENSSDEIGELGRALESITQNLGETISRVRVAALEMDTMSVHVRDASRDIAGNAGTQAQSVQQTGSAMTTMSDTSSTVEAQILEATRSAETSAERLHQISAAIESISAAVNQLAVAVDQGQSHVQSNLDSLRDVDGVVVRLHQAVEGTATTTAEISASIRSVDASAAKAFQMSSDASVQARSGVEAVGETREGIEEIREFTNRAVDWIRFLSEKVASIEQILDVITDIANQTRLLSLNASIIASQAGEYGRGFLVVADEIKALAAKTSGSTREIGGVINEVLGVSGKVLDVVEKGVSIVDEAMVRSEHANVVLDGILVASTQTGNLVRGIAGAMNEQSRGAQRVDQAMQDVHGTAIALRDIVAGQKHGGVELQTAMARMRELMARALQTSKDQAEQVEGAIASMGSVFEQIRRIGEMNEGQAGSRDEVARAFDLLEQISGRHLESARSLAAAVERAAAQSASLTESVKVFRV